MNKILLLFLISMNAMAMDANKAREISKKHGGVKIDKCAKRVIRELNKFIEPQAKEGGYDVCTIVDDCKLYRFKEDFDEVYSKVYYYFQSKGYSINNQDGGHRWICVDWSEK